MFSERNIHEYKKQILSLNQVDELSDASKDEKQKDEYSRRQEEPNLEEYEWTKKAWLTFNHIEEQKEKYPLGFSKMAPVEDPMEANRYWNIGPKTNTFRNKDWRIGYRNQKVQAPPTKAEKDWNQAYMNK